MASQLFMKAVPSSRPGVSVPDLAGETILQFPPGWGIRQRLNANFAAAGVHPNGAYEVADYAIAAMPPTPTFAVSRSKASSVCRVVWYWAMTLRNRLIAAV